LQCEAGGVHDPPPGAALADHSPVELPPHSDVLGSTRKEIEFYRRYVTAPKPKGRGFPLGRAMQFGIRGCWYGRYRGRVLVPVLVGGQAVAFVARDATNKSSRKVLNGPDGVTTSEMVFNRDAVERALANFGADDVVVRLTEGVFDAIRSDREEWGQPAIAPLGTHLSDYVLDLLVRMGVKNVCLLWDADTWVAERLPKGGRSTPKAAKAIQKLKSRFSVTAVRLPVGTDPDDHSEESIDRMVADATPCSGFDLFKVEVMSQLSDQA